MKYLLIALLAIILCSAVVFATLTRSDNVITDDATDLMWQRSIGNANWDEAVAIAAADTSAGFNDWRLPTVSEFEGIVVSNRPPPRISPLFGLSRNPRKWTFWSADADTVLSPPAGYDGHVIITRAFAFSFEDGYDFSAPKANHYSFRLVRTLVTNVVWWDATETRVSWTDGGDLILWQ